MAFVILCKKCTACTRLRVTAVTKAKPLETRPLLRQLYARVYGKHVGLLSGRAYWSAIYYCRFSTDKTSKPQTTKSWAGNWEVSTEGVWLNCEKNNAGYIHHGVKLKSLNWKGQKLERLFWLLEDTKSWIIKANNPSTSQTQWAMS